MTATSATTVESTTAMETAAMKASAVEAARPPSAETVTVRLRHRRGWAERHGRDQEGCARQRRKNRFHLDLPGGRGSLGPTVRL